MHEDGPGAGPPRSSPKKRKAGVKSAATFSSEQVSARWQSYQAKIEQPDMQQLAATRAALPIASYRSVLLSACTLPIASCRSAFVRPGVCPLTVADLPLADLKSAHLASLPGHPHPCFFATCRLCACCATVCLEPTVDLSPADTHQ